MKRWNMKQWEGYNLASWYVIVAIPVAVVLAGIFVPYSLTNVCYDSTWDKLGYSLAQRTASMSHGLMMFKVGGGIMISLGLFVLWLDRKTSIWWRVSVALIMLCYGVLLWRFTVPVCG